VVDAGGETYIFLNGVKTIFHHLIWWPKIKIATCHLFAISNDWGEQLF
jgi:hypothetical protein